jgi:anhydro-N-acetylmuramic acid kinase
MLAIGLMSGTSVDGVDGVLARFSGQGPQTRIQTLSQASRPMPPGLRAELLALQSPGGDELARAAEAAVALTDLYAEVVADLQAKQPALAHEQTVIGAHGQTVRHRPERGYTLQLIHGAQLAESTGLDTVVDFRSADVAAGGQGAPLVPAFHALAFASETHRRAIVNVGGIANVSLLPPGGGQVTGHDTGPGNLLMDYWCERHTGQVFDASGAWASTGQVHEALLSYLLAEPYFAKPAPKSTGRDLFTPAWLEHALRRCVPNEPRPQDVQATLLELTARLIARDCLSFQAQECHVCGGGAYNAQLMRRLEILIPQAKVQTTEALGVAPDAVEALAFAWLARQRVIEIPANLPAVTGARGRRVLGAVYKAAPSVG